MRRMAEETDFDAVFAIYMRDEVNPFLLYDLMAKEEFAPIFRQELRSGQWYVYERDDRIVGFYKVTRFEGKCDHIVQIGHLAIAPEHFGRGVAAAMMSELLEQLTKEGVVRIELIVECDNPRAISFYEKLGFQNEGTLRKYCRRGTGGEYVDDFIMSVIVD